MEKFSVSEKTIPTGDAGFVQKAHQMAAFAREDAVSQNFWPIVRKILADAGNPSDQDDLARLKAIYDACLKLQFTMAPPLVSQYLIRPTAFYNRGFGDCTAFATFISAVAGAIGYKSCYTFISDKPEGAISHVWTTVYYPARSLEKQIDLDPTFRRSEVLLGTGGFGWRFPKGLVTREILVEAM